MGHVAGLSLHTLAKGVVLVVVLAGTLLCAVLGAAGRLPAGMMSEAVSLAASTAASALSPTLKGLRAPRAAR